MSIIAQNSLPQIVIGRADHAVLSRLAAAGAGSAEDLAIELERASVVADEALPEDVVRMGSVVAYRVDGRAETVVTLVYPEHADISRGRVSVLTPIGTALLGLAPGQSIPWETRDGRVRQLTIVRVAAGEDGGEPEDGEGPEDPGPVAA